MSRTSSHDMVDIPSIEVHAAAIIHEGTLCGDMPEGECLQDINTIPTIAQRGQVVTCENCVAIIDYSKKFKGYRQP